MLVLGLTLSPAFNMLGLGGVFRSLVYAFFLLLSGVYIFYLWNLLRNFTTKALLIKSVFYLLLAVFALAILIENPFYKCIAAGNRANFLFIIHLALLLIELIVTAYAIADVFSGRTMSASKLWGSACIYLMTALLFASIFDLVQILHPLSFGISIPLGFASYSESVYYSINALIKLEDRYQQATAFVKKLKTIESVCGDLFIALLVGNLLNKRMEKQELSVTKE